MILLRKPLRIYDADLVGIALLLAMGLGTYYGAWVPHTAQAHDHSELAESTRGVESQTAATRGRLEEVEAHIEQLTEAIGQRAASIPNISELNDIVNAIFADAQAAGLHISSVKPNTPARVDEHLSCDLEILGSGFSKDLVAFLERMARERPYHSLEAYALSRDRTAGGDRCMITLTLRVYFATDDIAKPSGDSP